jgi:iron complex outermembrane receptor protein
MSNLKKILLLIVVGFFLQKSISAQVVDTTALNKVIIEGVSIRDSLQNIPAAINLLQVSEIQRADPQLLTQAFNRKPGVFSQVGALNTNRITIRGIGSRAQYGTNRIKAYFNEIPITTGDGQTVINNIDQNAVGRIEIIKGPNSSIYGAGLGGVIHLYGKSIDFRKKYAEASSSFGSYGLQNNQLSTGYSDGKKSFYASYNHLQKDGFRDNSNYDRKTFTLNGTLQSSENSSLSFLGNFTRLKAFIPSSLNEEDFENNPENAAFTWNQAQGYESYDRLMAGLSYSHRFSDKIENTTSVFVNYRDAYEPRPFDILKQNSFNLGARTKFNYSTLFGDLPVNASLGGEFLNENYNGSNFENKYEELDSPGSLRGKQIANIEQNRNYYNGFLQANLEATSNLKLTAGLNVNATDYSLTDFFNRDGGDQSGDYQFKTIWSPRFAVLYSLSRNKNLYANISKGFSTPTVDETLTPQGRINTNLKPETGWNYEVGFKGNFFKNLYTEIAIYTIQINDLLVAERVAEDQFVGTNAGKTDHNGVEFLAKYNWNIGNEIWIKPYFSFNYNDYSFDEFVDEGTAYSGNDLTGIPESKLNFGIDLNSKMGLSLNSNALFVSQIPLNDANSKYTNSYQVVNFKLGYNFQLISTLKVKLNFGVNNLLDEHYAASIVPNAVGFGGSAPRYYYPGMPRNFYGGIGLNYNFQ